MTNNTHILELSAYTQPEIIEDGRDKWVEYGTENDYYTWLIDRRRNSTTNGSIINNIARLMYGRGLYAKNANKRPNDFAQMLALFRPHDLRAAGDNLYHLGQGAYQLIYNKAHNKIVKVKYMPINLIRPEKCDKDGNITGYYYSDNWSDTKAFPPKRIPAFGTSNEGIELVVFGAQSVGRKYFSAVAYEPCLDYCILEERISEYLINDVDNGFSGTKVVNFNNGVPTEEQQKIQAKKVLGKLTGARGQKVIVSFNNNQEQKTTVDDIPLNDAPDHYNYLSTECRNKILVGHCITSPMLVGISPDGQGFSSNADEIEVAAKYFHNTAIRPQQDIHLDAIAEVLAFNNISLDLFFRRLNLFEDIEADEQKSEEVAMSKQVDEKIFNELDKYADNDLEGWELIDSQDVDYDLEEQEDAYLESLNKSEKSLLSKVWDFVSTGTARPNASSEQDGNIFKSRYRYTGDVNTNSRDFCKRMIKANKVYRKEDIIQMGSQVVNKGWGPEGADTYSIWLYKGGGACGHKWVRETYLKKSDANSPLARKYTPAEVRKAGEIVPLTDKDKNGKAVNDERVYTAPKDMPYEGFLPTNKRFQ